VECIVNVRSCHTRCRNGRKQLENGLAHTHLVNHSLMRMFTNKQTSKALFRKKRFELNFLFWRNVNIDQSICKVKTQKCSKWKTKKTTWVFFFYKYGKFWSISPEQKIELKPFFLKSEGLVFRRSDKSHWAPSKCCKYVYLPIWYLYMHARYNFFVKSQHS